MVPIELIAWGAIPVVGIVVVAGVLHRRTAEREARLGALRSFRASTESYRREQSELLQRAMYEARHSTR